MGKRKIVFPITPEYIGYANQGLHPAAFHACKPLDRRTGRRRIQVPHRL
jgi:alanine-alpha-ketoisovalerate/valine-pyruvate aminotransferase